MRLVIQGKNLDITDAIHDYVQQKIGKAMMHFEHLTTKTDVKLSVPSQSRKQPRQNAEVTVFANGTVIRAEENHENLYASIDLVADKLSRQLQKYKGKKAQFSKSKRQVDESHDHPLVPEELTQERAPELPQTVVRNKFFAMPSMTAQDALENLQLVDHDFYVFRNESTEEINVIYERNHGGYGIIQPREENKADQSSVSH
ncbi:Ribosome hibernation promotion factor [Acaryochloris thomasi RCC1774]|uniref:Ribosome hibernation promoting factor n=1 Tax=Acaryochloris thomasi RCC1774 TaxID=1764569 RepID=A0A2W1J9M6_9CYAN|nr:ribosome-associated translation inhibitor RaiA [Acaryochloris thomasi]PZD70939.1 Ribosome hibernation promotion factor [Acaryochloris thomasi RCC1774]